MIEPPTDERWPTLRSVVAVLDEFYPPANAQSWDRVGLTAGDLDQPVRRVHFAVDPTLAVIAEAGAAGADLLVTHHPLLLRGIHAVTPHEPKGAALTALLCSDLALYTAHTNADVARPGVNTALAVACGLDPGDAAPLSIQEGQGLGLVGDLTEAVSLRDFVTALASRLPHAPVGVRASGPAQAPVRRVALLGGAGDSLFDAVRESHADVYVTSDLRHHPASEAREHARGGPPYLVDAGHWATEQLWLREACDRLVNRLSAEGASVDGYVSTLCTDPWTFVVGADGPHDDDSQATQEGTW